MEGEEGHRGQKKEGGEEKSYERSLILERKKDILSAFTCRFFSLLSKPGKGLK